MKPENKVVPEVVHDFPLDWDELLKRCDFQTVFLGSDWLRCWLETLGSKLTPIIVLLRSDSGLAVAGAAFVLVGKTLRFVGYNRSDYCDFLLEKTTPEILAQTYVEIIAVTALQYASKNGAHDLHLSHIPNQSAALRLLGSRHLRSLVKYESPAPEMDMAEVQTAINKKSLRRHEKGLKKLGSLDFVTYRNGADIEPRLEDFFQLHIRRWKDTKTPSLFLKQENCDFYRKFSRTADKHQKVRYSELRLDQRLIAAHFGFLDSDRFIWYKPAFDIDYKKKSPGEVLLRYLLMQAEKENAKVFDFTIGDESFKLRFATETKQVSDIMVTKSSLLWAQHLAKKGINELLERLKNT